MDSAKPDRRVRYTKRALSNALVDLLHEKHISKVSVTELCERADVNRSTFYAHFRSPDDLLAHIEAEALGDLKAYLLADEPRTDNVTRILEYAQANARVFLMLLSEGREGFQRQVIELAHLVDLQVPTEGGAPPDDALEYAYLYTVSGTLSIVARWLQKGTPQTPAEIAGIILRITSAGVQERL